MTFTGKDLINAGIPQGPHIGIALREAKTLDEAIDIAKKHILPVISLQNPLPILENIDVSDDEAELINYMAVMRSLEELTKTPVVKSAAILPDACPAGSPGTIPVGSVVASEGLHPGMHSSDICCSVAISVFNGADPEVVMEKVFKLTHFGPGGRTSEQAPKSHILKEFEGNPYLKDLIPLAISHNMTQGDGNHFAFVGTLKSTGEVALVTHHGSRGPGAKLYKRGMVVANQYRQKLSPQTLKQNAWIPEGTKDCDNYWSALQTIREWTKYNHFDLHDIVSYQTGYNVKDRFWNEHNFVFRKSDGLFYHAKGSTPAFKNWAPDATDLTLIPLNMAEPVLITRGSDSDNSLGFSPHGAGRNYSRTAHKKLHEDKNDHELFESETEGLDVRFFCGQIDISELPSAYKNAASVKRQIEEMNLAEVIDEVLPYGTVMAGDWEHNMPWKKRVK